MITFLVGCGFRGIMGVQPSVCLTFILMVALHACVPVLLADTHYVSLSGGNISPYTNWANAATNIQSAVDAAGVNDTVLVTNGVYATGGGGGGGNANRVVINKVIIVQSVNGPAVTVVQGNGPMGDSAVRCVYISANATLSGFTITNGATRAKVLTYLEVRGGGVYCETQCLLSNCWITGNSAADGGGGVYMKDYGTLKNCMITDNTAKYGGGVKSSRGTIDNCTLTGNTAAGEGGGASGGTLSNCLITGNSADMGGGAENCALNNCTITGNSAWIGGGVYYSNLGSLNNCIVYYNTASSHPNYYYRATYSGTINYCCTTPLPDGTGNITNEPCLVSAGRIAINSPCVGAAKTLQVSGLDIDGETWGNPPSIGADEPSAAASIGALSVTLVAAYTNVATGFEVSLKGLIQGRATRSVWDFGDNCGLTNQPYASHTWKTPGIYAVVLTAWSASFPSGIACTTLVSVVEPPVCYANISNATPAYPYTSWQTAATNIQDAIDADSTPGRLVLVADGEYESGGSVVYGTMTNRIVLANAVTVRSVNGPAVTIIRGNGPRGPNAVRCANLGVDCVLDGFTITTGATLTNGHERMEQSGGGVWCDFGAMVTNCTLTENSASYGGGAFGGTFNNCTLIRNSGTHYGGGAYRGTLNNCSLDDNFATYGGGVAGGALHNCSLSGNSAKWSGGGTFESTLNSSIVTANVARLNSGGGGYSSRLNNCTLTGNSAGSGGGAESCILNNCIVYYNTAATGPNFSLSCKLSYCCTMPLADGTGNITNDPGLVSTSHIAADSPCVGRANAMRVFGEDIDGEAWRDPPSIGVDEPYPASTTGTLSVAIGLAYAKNTAGYDVPLTALIQGTAARSVWDFGDGSRLTNQPHAGHIWTTPGDYNVVLTAWNATYPIGISCTALVSVITQPVFYVNVSNPTPVFPYTSWATAATNIQQAIDADSIPGRLVLVADGVYESGGAVVFEIINTNRIACTNAVTVRSVNGPQVTIIRGQGPRSTNAVRCAYIGTGAVLAGFTLTNGAGVTTGDQRGAQAGGGVWCEPSGLVSNCWILGNSGYYGGGAYHGILNNCIIAGNSAFSGGGAYQSTLNGCTIAGNSRNGAMGCTLNYCVVSSNSAYDGGGANYCMINSSIITGNTANFGGGVTGGTLNNCVISRNYATNSGGGAGGGTLNNCTITGNSAGGGGGGTVNATLKNCIIYYNTASSNANWYIGIYSNVTYCCTTPAVAGVGNITNAPVFQNSANDDYRLSALSPCLDAGINQDWMFAALDLDGKPRILNGTVDMGAYETPFTLNLRVLLQGPYDVGSHFMQTVNTTNLPVTSPYANDPASVITIPSNVVDWVLVELLNTNGNTVVSKSALLNTQGQVLSANGSLGLTAEVSAGYYSILIKHRNHLAAMSAQPVAFTNILVPYDFTIGADQHAGGAGAAVLVEPGVWGLLAGDADGDGVIQLVDAVLHTNQMGRTGYARADFDLDGVVSTNDLALWSANQGRQSGATHGETILQPGLILTPARKTLLAGATLTFTSSGGAGTSQWFFAQSSSGGQLTPISATSALYTAGNGSNCVDIIEAWDGDRLGRAYVNVISAAEVARSGKALVLAGRRSTDDPLWPTTDYLANFAYNDLLYRGFAKRNLQYLSPEPSQDVDGNGAVDDIALPSTKANAAFSFTNWAMSNPDRLFIYLVDHGGTSSGVGFFRLNDLETVTAVDLDQWLDAIQDRYANEVIVVVDFCESGSFLAPLKHTGPGKRTVITACATNEPTYFVAGGMVSFSDAFFNGVLSGLDVADAFEFARAAMLPYQSAWLDADGDGVYVPANDLPQVAGTYVGASFVAGKDIPEVGHVMGGQALDGATTSTLWAYDIVSVYPLERVWCLVVPPNHQVNPTNPVADLPMLELTYNPDTGRYEAQYSGFSEVGLYKLIYYAQDIWGSVSQPQQSYVQQNGFQERVILVAGSVTNSPNWAGIDNLAQMAYNTFRNRRFATEAIYYLSPLPYEDLDQNGINDVQALSTVSNLCHAITNWAVGANKLTVYLVGEGASNLFRLNETETLAPMDLRAWLDIFQSTNGEVQVVMDFSGAGAYLPILAAPGQSRICLASAKPDQPSLFANGGMVSFSRFFLPDIFNGCNINLAYTHAREAIKNASGSLRQEPQLDDNGDGVSSKADGKLAATRYIGPAFLTGADAPVIGSVVSNTTLLAGSPLVLWAKGVVAADGVSNVWCVVTPPDYDGSGDLAQVNLAWNTNTSRHEAVYTNFTQPGAYAFTFYALDNSGQLSSARQCEVTVTNLSEADDSALQAAVFPVGDTQPHSVYSATDEDWVKFYAPTGMVFEVKATQRGTNSDLRLDLYYEQADGTLTNVDWTDNYGSGSNVMERLTLDLKTRQSGLLPGGYYVKVSSADTNLFGPGSEYELQIYVPTGSGGGVVLLTPWVGGGLFAPGWLQVSLGPPAAMEGGAGWRLVGHPLPDYYSNNSALYGLLAGGYTVEFKPVSGFQTPTNRSVQIISGQTAVINGNYLVFGPGMVAPLRSTNGVFAFGLTGQPGKIYVMEASTNLGQTNWTIIATNTMGSNGVWQFADPASTNLNSRYYRAREQ